MERTSLDWGAGGFLASRLLRTLAGTLPFLCSRCHLLDREEHIQACALSHRQNLPSDLVDRVLLDFLTTVGAISAAAPRKEPAQVVGNLGRRGNGGPRVPRGILLPDGDPRCDAVEQVHIRFFHPFQEL